MPVLRFGFGIRVALKKNPTLFQSYNVDLERTSLKNRDVSEHGHTIFLAPTILKILAWKTSTSMK